MVDRFVGEPSDCVAGHGVLLGGGGAVALRVLPVVYTGGGRGVNAPPVPPAGAAAGRCAGPSPTRPSTVLALSCRARLKTRRYRARASNAGEAEEPVLRAGALKRRAGWISRSEIPAPPAFEARGSGGGAPRERAKGG
ncbi:hypothetical protein Slala02_20120 [Streptomyces lavendulae subsp. lavendulae]|nr:hypothetical protein Slala01_14920 [Streptomyces lavendulae subsp. lavendulae]GLX26192.1 hypothetical protein Slala02_20120 [Streptomyces lavendulae subsp. lavendulae]